MILRKLINQIHFHITKPLIRSSIQKSIKILPIRPRRAKSADKKRTAVSSELRQYLRELQKSNANEKLKKDFEELAHYSYMFDLNFYKKQLDKNEAYRLESTGDVIRHYCEQGWKDGLDPSVLFETRNHLKKYPTRKKNANNPLIHFVRLKFRELINAVDNEKFMRKIADIKEASDQPTLNEEALQSISIGVFLHIFYIDNANTLAENIENIPGSISIYISTRRDLADEVKEIFSKVKNSRRTERAVPCP